MNVGSAFYRGESGEDYQRSVHGDAIDSEAVFNAKATLATHRYFGVVSKSARVLEYGVGIGTNLARLPNKVRHGYDPGEFARALSEQRGISVFDDPDGIPSSSYDVVLCRHVLEHVEAPLDELRRIKTYLSDKGYLLLILPVERTDRGAKSLPRPDVNNHLYTWGPQQIVNLLNAAELRPLRHRYFWYSMQARLRWLSRWPWLYSALVTAAGVVRRQREIAIWAVPM